MAEISEGLLRSRMECLRLTRESLRPSSSVSNEGLDAMSSKAMDSAIPLDVSVDSVSLMVSVPEGGRLGSDSSKALLQRKVTCYFY